jgi:hypothetical protein
MAHFAVAAVFCLSAAGLGHKRREINNHSIAASKWWLSSMKSCDDDGAAVGRGVGVTSFVLLGWGRG